jgi:hypothetical protein
MITKADETCWEFQKHVSLYSNSQSTVHFTPVKIIALHSHTQSVVCCTFGEHSAFKNCVACICQTTVHRAT